MNDPFDDGNNYCLRKYNSAQIFVLTELFAESMKDVVESMTLLN